MKKLVFTASMSLIVALLGSLSAQAPERTDKKGIANELSELANKAHAEQNYDRAFGLWGQIQTDYKGTIAWSKAVYNTGIALKKQKRIDETVEAFNNLVVSDINDTEPGAGIMEAWRNYRPKAQREIGKALRAYQAVEEKHLFRSWHGTC
jgi:hypothetical protein